MRKLLTEGEDIILTMRTHLKALLVPAVVLILACGILGFLLAVVDQDWLRWTLVALAAVVIVWWVLAPFARWITQTYTITNRRVVEQHGVFTRTGRAIPLHRVSDVTYEKGVIDRMLGCGTLIVREASESSGLVLHDVPHVESVHRTLTDLVFDLEDREDDGTGTSAAR